MKDDEASAYFVSRSAPRKTGKRRSSRRAAGLLIATLLLLTAVVCLIVVFMPPRSEKDSVQAAAFGGKTYYFLYTAECTEKLQAETNAAYTAERGGAGFIYNDGTYKIVAAVYERESDVKTLVTVNPDSGYFALSLPKTSGDRSKIADHICGEWYATMYLTSTELDRGNITEAAAERAVSAACDSLARVVYDSGSDRVKRIVLPACEQGFSSNKSVLSNVRYITARVIVAALSALQ